MEKAWKKACGTPGGTILIPKGTFLVSSGDFKGPCKGTTKFRIDGTLVASSGFGGNKDFWLIFNKVDRLIFFGTGTLNGNGASTWAGCKVSKNCDNRPTVSNYKQFNSSTSLFSFFFVTYIYIYRCHILFLINLHFILFFTLLQD